METNQKQKIIPYYGYPRKSSEDKAKQVLSISSQIEWGEELAEERGLTIAVPFETFAEEKSAKKPYKRPRFNEMVKTIKKNGPAGIICWKLDRLARNPEEAGIITGMLQRGEIQHIITSDREYYPDDNAIISSVEFGMANQFIRDLSKNVKRGLDKKVKMGERPGRAPLGYKNSKTNLKGEQIVYNDPERFDLVRQAWQLLLTGNYSVPQILDIANKEWKLTIPATKTRPERELAEKTLYKIYKNTFFYGRYLWGGEWVRGNHEPIITEAEFNKAQILLGRKGRPRPKAHEFAFTGLMKCGFCGASIIAEEKWKYQKNGNVHHYIYYRCSKKLDKKCPEKYIEIDELERQIDKTISGIVIPEKFKNWAIKHLHTIKKDEDKSLEEITASKQRRYESLSKQISNLLVNYNAPENSDGKIMTMEEYTTLRSVWLKEKTRLEAELGTASKDLEEWITLSQQTFQFACYAGIWFKQGDLATKRAIFNCVGSNLLIKDRKLVIELKKPFQLVADGLSNAQQELSRLEPVKIPENRADFGKSVAEFPLLSG
ncbi:MAG: recombinase family protein [Candidatus Staskawiczbacteria bacterium]|nr:recombinase family protein [Candidatus Staskawiczbacteria bacterium]